MFTEREREREREDVYRERERERERERMFTRTHMQRERERERSLCVSYRLRSLKVQHTIHRPLSTVQLFFVRTRCDRRMRARLR